jgi:hypothetical protein
VVVELIKLDEFAVGHYCDVESALFADCLGNPRVECLFSVEREAELDKVYIVAFTRCDTHKVFFDSSVLFCVNFNHHFGAFEYRAP